MNPGTINGYFCIKIRGGTKRVHRMVAEAFNIPRAEDATVINHIDHNKRNNSLENLEWVTQQENMTQYFNHCINTKRAVTPQRLGFFNEETGDVILFRSYTEAKKHFGVSLATLWGGVQDCWNSETRKFHGYVVRKLDKDGNIVE